MIHPNFMRYTGYTCHDLFPGLLPRSPEENAVELEVEVQFLVCGTCGTCFTGVILIMFDPYPKFGGTNIWGNPPEFLDEGFGIYDAWEALGV